MYWLNPHLGKRLEAIRKAVESLLGASLDPGGDLPTFTPHGTKHFERVENRLHHLLPGETALRLSEYERFLLLASAWTHDIGMIRGIFPGDASETAERVRETHDQRSVRYIGEHHSELGIEEPEVVVFAQLARFHRRRYDLVECEERLSVGDTQVRLRVLAAYLRLADALDLDLSRAPQRQYAIALSYDLPAASKLHWLRSQFVQGIQADAEGHRIVVTFQRPRELEERLERTLEDVYDLVRSDLGSELDSVRNVLLESGITYFLRVEESHVEVDIRDQTQRDLASVLNYFQLLDNPSSSALSRLLLDTTEAIAASHAEKVAETLGGFLNDLERRVLGQRRCHVALRRLAQEVRERAGTLDAPTISAWVRERRAALDRQSAGLRVVARGFLEQRFEAVLAGRGSITVVLYGYSDQVMRALLGFRDAVRDTLLRRDAEQGRAWDLAAVEAEAAARFRLFVCEGQPKNHVEYSGRVRFHDGCSYALALSERGFRDILIVPDAVACSLILPPSRQREPEATFVMVGANGFDDTSFIHSAGHLMIVAARALATREPSVVPPTMVLAVTTDKHSTTDLAAHREPASSAELTSIHDGWRFHGSFAGEPVRRRPFFAQDPALRARLESEAPSVAFYNPREDLVPIRWLDVVLTENRYFVLSEMPAGTAGSALLERSGNDPGPVAAGSPTA